MYDNQMSADDIGYELNTAYNKLQDAVIDKQDGVISKNVIQTLAASFLHAHRAGRTPEQLMDDYLYETERGEIEDEIPAAQERLAELLKIEARKKSAVERTMETLGYQRNED